MNQREQAKAAKEFAESWQGKGDEKQDTQRFWIELLHKVFGVEDTTNFLKFETRVKLTNQSYIDVMIPATHTMIEQKSLGKDLNAPVLQSDGSKLTPFEQAKRYAGSLPYSERPRWIVTCNFAEFQVFNMERPNDAPQVIKLTDLPTDYYRLGFMVNEKDERIARELQLSKDAGELVARIYKAVLPAYDTNDVSTKIAALQSLNKLCVRLVFLFYAEDAGLFPKKNQFCDYMKDFSPAHFRRALVDLFRILNTPDEERDKYEEPQLLAFPYVNGGLFSEKIDVPQFSEDAVNLIIKDGGGFDWSQISPTIFGAIFESTLNPAHRREGGMHYTSPENIHKVIDPLFLDGYRAQFQAAMAEQGKARKKKLLALQDELARAKFFDPAAGSGNFLTESYRSLRRLENDILRELITKEKGGLLGFEELNPIKVSINQFYGIEINDFAVSVAKTAIWIAESQCFKETEDIIHRQMDFLPLKTEANIHEGNALRMEWRDVLPPSDDVYLMGNPPFVGARIMAAGSVQKTDMAHVFAGWKNFGNLDYVSAWYKKAADYMVGTQVCAAFVSTNSITQGDSVATLWKPLFEQGIKIFFAHRTFKWNSESKNKAAVYCVIVGFSYAEKKARNLYTDGQPQEVTHINAYLIDAPDIFVESREKPLCHVPEIGIGNKPIDGGNYLFTKEERDEFLKLEPKAEPYFKPWYGAQEFLHNKPRFCLWLGACKPNDLNAMKHCKKRVEAVREFRLKSSSAGTRKLAETPMRFHVENMPTGTYIAIPKTSSENRRYIPMDFFTPNILCGDALFLMPDATLYHFGVLQSNVHMAWMRTIAGRLEMRYRYSKDIVYNNFPWAEVTEKNEKERAAIERTAQAILDARALYPESSLADLYDVNTMPKELREAHRANDRAVMKAYKMPTKTSEAEAVALLMARYEILTAKK